MRQQAIARSLSSYGVTRQWVTVPWWRIQWKQFPRYWPFVRGNLRLSVNSPHRGQWHGSLMDVFFDMHLNEQMSKQSWDWWFQMPWRPMLSHNVSWFIYVFEASALIGLDMVFGKRLVQTRAMTFTVIEYSAGLRNVVFCKLRESFDQAHLTVTCPHTHHLFFFTIFQGFLHVFGKLFIINMIWISKWGRW